MTVKAAASALEWSEGKIWRIETGQSSKRSHDAELMCRIYGADPEMKSRLAARPATSTSPKAAATTHPTGCLNLHGFP
jgi:hypothetical protein